MRIEYVLSRDDYIQFYLYLRERQRQRFRRSRWYWPAVAFGWLTLGGLVFSLYFAVFKGLLFYAVPLFPDDNRLFGGLAGFTALIALAVIAYRRPWQQKGKYGRIRLLRRRVDSYERKGRLFIGYQCELVLGEKELVLTVWKQGEERGAHYSDRRQHRIPWSEVESIEESDMHAFILTRGSMGVFIPKSAFRDALIFREFVEAGRRFRTGVPNTAITASLPVVQIEMGIQDKAATPLK
jgi:YcxB-like protein